MATAPHISVRKLSYSGPIKYNYAAKHRTIEDIPEVILAVSIYHNNKESYRMGLASEYVSKINKLLKTTQITYLEYLEMLNRFTRGGDDYYLRCLERATILRDYYV
jgi:hypothetical protein